MVCPRDQRKAAPRIVPHGGDLSPSRREGASLLCHAVSSDTGVTRWAGDPADHRADAAGWQRPAALV